ncbi:hypothetical protein ACFWWC_48110 [Streptomyces sp. NPDC058642]|uniref:hypothetical protein n=1 Tax=Streptomyces sp. NPDC058642 TaxID=3346572 RepID=UPI00366706FF
MNRGVMGERIGLCVRQAAWLLVLVLLGALASLAVTGFLLVGPQAPLQECSGPAATSLVQDAGSDDRRCAWERAVEEISPDAMRRVDIKENRDGATEVRLSIVVPSDSALAQDTAEGKAADELIPFLAAVWGVPTFDGAQPEWKVPVVMVAQGSPQTEVVLSGTVATHPGDWGFYSKGPTTLQLSVPTMRLRAVTTTWHVRSQSADSLSAETREPGLLLSVAVVSEDAKPAGYSLPGVSSAKELLSPLGSYAPKAGDVLTALGRALLAAAGWVALLLAWRVGPPPLGEEAGSLYRLKRITGAVVLVHLAIWVIPWFGTLDPALGSGVPRWVRDDLSELLGWEPVDFAPLSGALVLLVTAILVIVPRLVIALMREDDTEAPVARSRRRTAGLGLAAAGALAAATASLLALADPHPQEAASRVLAAVLLSLVLAVILAVLALYAVAVARRAGWDIGHPSLLWAAAFAPIVAVGASVHSGGGELPPLIRWSGPLLAGTVMVLATGVLAWWAVTGSKPSRVGLFLAVPAAVLLALAWDQDVLGRLGWWDLHELTRQLDGILGLVLVAAAVKALYVPVRSLGTGTRALRGLRALGIVLMFILGSGTFSLLTIPSPVTVGAAALMVWVLFPYGQIRRAAVVLAQSREESVGALNDSVRMGTLRRALPALRKNAHATVADGPPADIRALGRLRSVERASYDVGPVRANGVSVRAHQRAFGAYISPEPWKRATRTAASAAVLGAPGTLLSLAGAVVSAGFDDRHPVLAVLTTAAPILLTWVGFGLLYGYFFPVLRGETGLSKALWMWGVMIVPPVLQVVASRDPSHWSSWTGTILYGLQALTFAMSLGLFADAAVLAANRMRAARLVDIHNLGFITAWLSSVAVALASGVATVIIGGVAPFVLDIFPEAPQAPEPSASPSAGR